MSHSKDTLFLINRNGWQLHWDSAVSIHQLEAAAQRRSGKAELHPSSAKPKSAHTSLPAAWGWDADFVLGWPRGAPAIPSAQGLPNFQRRAKSLGQKAPGFCRRNVSGSHVRIITAESWYFLWRRQNEIIKSLHWTGYAAPGDVDLSNGATDSAHSHHAGHVYQPAV